MAGTLADYWTAPGGMHAGWLLGLALAWFTVLAVRLSAADIRTRRLPDALVLPSYPVAGALLAAAALAVGESGRIAGMLLGAAGLGAGFFVLRLLNPSGLGLGDVKLAGLLGLYLGFLGPGHVLAGTMAAFVFGGIWGLGLILSRRGTASSTLPFGPFMLLGAAAAMLAPGLQ
ncbi:MULTISPECIES: prepilin peptidase [unclassified Arthrobacter]|uniref:prepilin peptidase n=1 Tax=unclassified Arthrobacter TaxID=235627 RepID=UPI001D1341AA|nr:MULTISPECIES: prepilin peptidase [unclassified Arthrobacter]MCC3277179.1 prepilin peptidase [Arthrobacter sp. zg-Y20]MCC9179075.1 prepilin peptidase [Arthrobacter sp. zg-Y750]MDK1317340.1 prepilin peptidase [Arthrobacter sp. zg.Y20]WIB07119.1 prepilin peptidase [Arthrobacter sp. zg-Y20]